MDLIKPEEVVPQGFLSRLLAEFGVEWTNFVLLVGIAISSFGLDPYVNAGIWTFGAILGFSAVYLLRRSIGPRFPRYFLLTVVFFIAVVVALNAVGFTVEPIGQLFQEHRNLLSLPAAIVITVPIAVCIISYRKQEDENLLDVPEELQRQIRSSILETPFCNRGVEFMVEFAEPKDGHVRVTYEVTLTPFNRSKRVQRLQDIVDPAGTDAVYEYATVDGQALDTSDPDYLSERGFSLIRDLQPGQELRWTVKLASTFYQRDWEFFGSFFPSTHLLVYVKAPPPSLKVSFISFLPKKVDPKKQTNGDLIFETRDGVLPFQGLKLVWEPRP